MNRELETMNTSCQTRAATPHSIVRTFIVRLWLEDLGDGHTEWRGRVQDVMNGQVKFFHGWERLTTTILDMLANRTSDARDASADDLPTQKR